MTTIRSKTGCATVTPSQASREPPMRPLKPGRSLQAGCIEGGCPRGSSYPTIEVLSRKQHTCNGFCHIGPLYRGTWTLRVQVLCLVTWRCNEPRFHIAFTLRSASQLLSKSVEDISKTTQSCHWRTPCQCRAPNRGFSKPITLLQERRVCVAVSPLSSGLLRQFSWASCPSQL